MKKLFALLLFLTVCIVITLFYVNKHLFQPLEYKTSLVFEIQKQETAKNIATNLCQNNLAPFPLFARFAMRLYGFDKKLKAGEYLLDPQLSLKDILEKLTSGKVMMHRLTIPEGLTTFKILQMIDQNEFLSGDITETVKEGEFFPETYTFAKGETKNNIIKKAKLLMQKTLTDHWNKRTKDLPLKDQRQLLILASIIEKETGLNAERGKVASVFINRLKLDMPLQTDPTVIYALTLGKKDLDRPLVKKDLSFDSPYNTYLYKGLPPTPICNPGVKAIEAATNPENTDFFYFVADGNGGHRFAKTLSDHNKNVQLWLKSK